MHRPSPLRAAARRLAVRAGVLGGGSTDSVHRCLADTFDVHTRVGLQFWFVIFEVTFTQSRSTIYIKRRTYSSRESSAVFIKPPILAILAPSRTAISLWTVIRVVCARFVRVGRAPCPVPVCTIVPVAAGGNSDLDRVGAARREGTVQG